MSRHTINSIYAFCIKELIYFVHVSVSMTQREIIGKTPKISKLAVALAIAGLMIIGGFVALASSQPTATSPTANAAATSQSILPNPVMNTNITWSTFYNGWSPLEYNTSTGNNTLHTQLNPSFANPISINPLDIVSKQLNPATATNLSKWSIQPATNGSVATLGTNNGIYITLNESAQAATKTYNLYTISPTSLPSNNLAYDYITIGFKLTGTPQTGPIANFYANNGNASYASPTINTDMTEYLTTSFASFATNTSQQNSILTRGINIGINLALPKTTANNTYTATITELAISETPYDLGTMTNTTGANNAVTSVIGNAELNTLNPNFAWTSITNNGYTVATSQQLQNVTIAQTAINNNGYSEQVTYQGTEYLPSAPDLSYSGSTISMAMNVSGKQFTIATLNGISYLSTIQGKANGTFVFDTVNPNNQNSIILQLDYTTAQWNSVSGAPPFFSLAGLEYYWWVGLIGFFSLIGLGSAALAHWGGEEENLRTPKGKFGR